MGFRVEAHPGGARGEKPLKVDLHNHTRFSDGRFSAEEMVQEAIRRGLDRFGISDHSYTDFDESYCMKREQYAQYTQTLRLLREKYKDRIELLLGVEQDYYSREIPQGLDYVIGSVHYLKIDGEYLVLDWDKERLRGIADRFFEGDFYRLCRRYYETVADLPRMTRCDIVGHFDLIAKFNGDGSLFDEEDSRYREAWQEAMLRLIPKVSYFEINYGARNKGLRQEPYLKGEMQDFLLRHGGRTICSSDSHRLSTIGCF